MNRVEHLADRPAGFVPPNSIPFKNLIPLDEIIADAKGIGKASQGVEREYRSCIARLGTEFEILNKIPKETLVKNLSGRIAEGILRVREGKVHIQAGYDGEYGKIAIFSDKDKPDDTEKQLSLF
jgi:PHP family Zn ribbon phosphoesterase